MKPPALRATALVARNSLDFVERLFSLQAAGKVVVIVADQGDAAAVDGIGIDRCLVPDERHGWYALRHALVRDDSPAQVTFTSGTEGWPKGIVLTHANLADTADRIVAAMALSAEVREYVGVPATYSFGLGRFRAICAVGGRAYLPQRGFDPLEFARLLAAGEVNALSAVPSLLRLLLEAPGALAGAGHRLRWLEIGSQYLSAAEKQAVRALFPNARIVQHYGLTEASRTTFLDVGAAPADRLESVGRWVGATEVATGEDGRIRIRGPHVARWRVDADGLHALTDAAGWLITNDLGHLREGDLYFDGRADDLINCGGIKVVPDLLEARIRALPGGERRLAVARVPDAMRGDGILVAVEGAGGTDTAPVRVAADRALRELGVAAGDALQVTVVDRLPVTATGKVQRAVLAARFAAREATASAGEAGQDGEVRGDDADAGVLALFREAFPRQRVTARDSFESLGGDSLRYIRFAMRYEQRFGPLPPGWERRAAGELQPRAGSTTRSFWSTLDTATFVRGAAMLCILALHADAFVYSPNYGAAYALVMMAGYSVVRFQLPGILRTGSVSSLLGTALRVAVPTVLVVAAMQVLTHSYDWRPLLLISNFFDPRTIQGFYYYFLEFYIQLLLVVALLFVSGRVRAAFARWPLESAIGVLLAAAAINLLADALWNTDYLYHRTPWHYGWILACGMVLAAADGLRRKCAALLVLGLSCWIAWGFTSASYWVAGAGALVLFLPTLVVPLPVKRLASELASASMFMYLSHFQVQSVVRKVFHQELPWLQLALMIVVGVVFAHAYDWLSSRVVAFWSRRQAARGIGSHRIIMSPARPGSS